MSIDDYFGKSVRAYRTSEKLSQRAFAGRLTSAGMPVDAAAISRIESGERSVRLQEASVIAGVLGVPLVSLIEDSAPNGSLGRAAAVIDLAIAELGALRESLSA